MRFEKCWQESVPNTEKCCRCIRNSRTAAQLPSKTREGRFVFLCPHCRELQATVNPRNNLAYCFGCRKNLNNFDLLMTIGYDFASAVEILEGLLERHLARLPKTGTTPEKQ